MSLAVALANNDALLTLPQHGGQSLSNGALSAIVNSMNSGWKHIIGQQAIARPLRAPRWSRRAGPGESG